MTNQIYNFTLPKREKFWLELPRNSQLLNLSCVDNEPVLSVSCDDKEDPVLIKFKLVTHGQEVDTDFKYVGTFFTEIPFHLFFKEMDEIIYE